MTPGSKGTLRDQSSPPVQPSKIVPAVVHEPPAYYAVVQQMSERYISDLARQIVTARARETFLWILFVLIIALTIVAGGVGVALIFLASIKVAIASGAAGVIPGCTTPLLKRGWTNQSEACKAMEKKLDEQLRLSQAAATIAEFPSGPVKRKLQEDYAKKMISRIPR